MLDTTNGNVVLDIRPLVIELGDRFQFVSNLDQRIPQDAGKITLLQSDQLSPRRTSRSALKAVADWIWVLVILCWAAAVWLVRRPPPPRGPGDRRSGSPSPACCCSSIRSVAGNYIVDKVVATESVKPAVSNRCGGSLTDSLAAVGVERDCRRPVCGTRSLAGGPGQVAVAARRRDRSTVAPRPRSPGRSSRPARAAALGSSRSRTGRTASTSRCSRSSASRSSPAGHPRGTHDVVGGACWSSEERLARSRAFASPSRGRRRHVTDELERLASLHAAGAL